MVFMYHSVVGFDNLFLPPSSLYILHSHLMFLYFIIDGAFNGTLYCHIKVDIMQKYTTTLQLSQELLKRYMF